jgi:hypothetical protein
MDLEFELDAMVAVFGEPLERHSHPERGDYWFEYHRPDGVVVRLILGLYDRKVAIGIDRGAAAGTSVHLEKCDRVRVLDAKRRTVEVVATEWSLRCFLALDGETLMTVEAPIVVA